MPTNIAAALGALMCKDQVSSAADASAPQSYCSWVICLTNMSDLCELIFQ